MTEGDLSNRKVGAVIGRVKVTSDVMPPGSYLTKTDLETPGAIERFLRRELPELAGALTARVTEHRTPDGAESD